MLAGACPTTAPVLERSEIFQVFDYHGDTNKQLARAMKAFSSSFARANRRKLLRKHFLAFDVNNTQRISREQFVETVNEVTRDTCMLGVRCSTWSCVLRPARWMDDRQRL